MTPLGSPLESKATLASGPSEHASRPTLHWIAPTEKDTATATLEKNLWDAADQFRANSGLKAQEYSGPILGLIFLRFADVRFAAQRKKLEKKGASSRRDRKSTRLNSSH